MFLVHPHRRSCPQDRAKGGRRWASQQVLRASAPAAAADTEEPATRLRDGDEIYEVTGQRSWLRTPRCVANCGHDLCFVARFVSLEESESTAAALLCRCILDKPVGLSFGRGNDSAAYVIAVDPKRGNIDERVEVRRMRRTAPMPFPMTDHKTQLQISMSPALF